MRKTAFHRILAAAVALGLGLAVHLPAPAMPPHPNLVNSENPTIQRNLALYDSLRNAQRPVMVDKPIQVATRTMTAGSLRGIVCQQLLPGAKDNLTIGYELLVGNLAVSNIIVEKMTHRLKGVMETGQKAGMCTFEGNVLEKFKLGEISEETARKYIRDKAVINEFEREVAIQGAKKLAHGGE